MTSYSLKDNPYIGADPNYPHPSISEEELDELCREKEEKSYKFQVMFRSDIPAMESINREVAKDSARKEILGPNYDIWRATHPTERELQDRMRPAITEAEMRSIQELYNPTLRRKIYGLIANSLVIIAILTLVYMCCTHQPQQ